MHLPLMKSLMKYKGLEVEKKGNKWKKETMKN